nr:MAG: internal scaffolding protein [Microvirus sp.]
MRMQGVNADGEEITSMFVHKAEKYAFVTEGPSLTRQEFADECDVNTLMARYETTGQMFPQARQEPAYLDLSEVPDLHSAMNTMNAAVEAFMSLPARVRFEFENDPLKFVEFAEDPENLEQMRQWGLAKPAEPTPEPLAVRVVPQESSIPPGAAAPAGEPTPKA